MAHKINILQKKKTNIYSEIVNLFSILLYLVTKNN